MPGRRGPLDGLRGIVLTQAWAGSFATELLALMGMEVIQIEARRLRDQITAPARTVLLVLLAASALVFIIACSNVANLILARTVRREGELALRAALGAGTGALRRTLLAESPVLCGAGALLGGMPSNAAQAFRHASGMGAERAARASELTRTPSPRATSFAPCISTNS